MLFQIIVIVGLACGICSADAQHAQDAYTALFNAFNAARDPLLIGHIVVDAQSGMPCIINNWNNVAAYACRCCLAKEAETVPGAQRDGTALIQNCKKHGMCTDQLIAQLRKDEQLEQASDTDFINALYERSHVIKSIELPKTSTFDGSRLTNSSLVTLLTQAYAEKKILDPAFEHASCLQVGKPPCPGGCTTTQIFLVQNTCLPHRPEFFVKGMAHRKAEAFDLALISHTPELVPYIAPHRQSGFPLVYVPISYLTYTASNGQKEYISVAPRAAGIEFAQLMNEYKKNPTQTNKDRLIKAYELLGQTLARFHKQFMRKDIGVLSNDELSKHIPDTVSPDQKRMFMQYDGVDGYTYIHGDFHGRNILYNEPTGDISWIDTEIIGRSTIVPQKIDSDIHYTIYFPFLAFVLEDPKPAFQLWAEQFFEPFFRAYLDAFGGNKYDNAQKMKKIVSYSSRWNDFAQQQASVMGPLMDRVIRSYGPNVPVR